MQASGFGPGPRALTLQPEGDGLPVRVIKSELLSPTRVLRHKRWRLGFLLFKDTTGLYSTSREVISPHLIIQISLLLLIKLNSFLSCLFFCFPGTAVREEGSAFTCLCHRAVRGTGAVQRGACYRWGREAGFGGECLPGLFLMALSVSFT